jgi:hypothetical protein
MDYTTLRADAHGVISAVMAEPGQVVAASAPFVRLGMDMRNTVILVDQIETAVLMAQMESFSRLAMVFFTAPLGIVGA